MGYALQRINVGWLKEKRIYYWGDIDTHGFSILNRLRAIFPHAESFLMNRETLLTHHELWVKEPDRCDETLDGLLPPENELFEDLKYDRLGERVRLEQERVRFGVVEQWLRENTGCDPGNA